MGVGIEMLPASPLPDDLAAGGHLQQVATVDRAVGVGAREAALNAADNVPWQWTETQQDDVAIAQPAGVVVVVRVTQLPDDSPAPIHFQHGAALEAAPRLEPLEILHDFAAIEEVAVVEQVTVEPGPVGMVQLLGTFAFLSVELDGPVPVLGLEER